MKVTSVQQGYNFITLYFDSPQNRDSYAKELYSCIRHTFPHMELQRKQFAHQPGDVPQFHAEGDPIELKDGDHYHFHIIYPKKVTKKDWEYIYLWGNRRELELDKELKIEKVKGRYNGV